MGNVTGSARVQAKKKAARLENHSIRTTQIKGGNLPAETATRYGAFDAWESSLAAKPALIDFHHTHLSPDRDRVTRPADQPTRPRSPHGKGFIWLGRPLTGSALVMLMRQEAARRALTPRSSCPSAPEACPPDAACS